jgi:hypothetical protein
LKRSATVRQSRRYPLSEILAAEHDTGDNKTAEELLARAKPFTSDPSSGSHGKRIGTLAYFDKMQMKRALWLLMLQKTNYTNSSTC